MSARVQDVEPVLELTGERTPPGRLLADVWRSRQLLVMLSREDFLARYRSARLGLLWSVAVPLLQGGVMALVFTRVVPIESADDYVTQVIATVAFWSFVGSPLAQGSASIVAAGPVATRIYFPRLILPAVAPTVAVPGLATSLLFVIGLMAIRGIDLTWTVLLLPIAGVVAWSFCALAGAVLAMLHVYFRDVRYLVQAGLLIWFYITPIVYPLEFASSVRALVVANPVTGVMQLVRFAIFGRATDLGLTVTVTGFWIVALAVFAVVGYSRHERIAADRL